MTPSEAALTLSPLSFFANATIAGLDCWEQGIKETDSAALLCGPTPLGTILGFQAQFGKAMHARVKETVISALSATSATISPAPART